MLAIIGLVASHSAPKVGWFFGTLIHLSVDGDDVPSIVVGTGLVGAGTTGSRPQRKRRRCRSRKSCSTRAFHIFPLPRGTLAGLSRSIPLQAAPTRRDAFVVGHGGRRRCFHNPQSRVGVAGVIWIGSAGDCGGDDIAEVVRGAGGVAFVAGGELARGCC